TLIPLLSRAAYRERAAGETPQPHLGVVDRIYTATLPTLLGRPILVALVAIVLVAGAWLAFTHVGTGFFPAADEGGFVIDCVTPAGTALQGTDERLKKVEALLAATSEVATFVRRTGSEMGIFATQQNSGDVLVRLKPRAERSRSAEAIIDDLRDKIQAAV